MSYCVNPDCSKPENPPAAKFCSNCQTLLLLNNRYRTLKIIGQGGMGRTFLAVDELGNEGKNLCVVKQFFPQTQNTDNYQKAKELFEIEINSLKRLGKHPQIPQLYNCFSQHGHQYLVQEWIEGDNLAQIIKKRGVFTQEDINKLLKDILPVLAFIHQCKIIHRDIKPENIILNPDNTLVLVDFGTAKILDQKLLPTGTVIGSAEYVSPEQLRGKAVVSSDIFSLGVTCLYLLTGISPFDLYSNLEDDWIWQDYLGKNKINQELSQIIDRMIYRAISKRYQSTLAILKDLKTEVNLPQELVFSPQDRAIKNINIDYSKLQNYLEAKQWQLANQETEKLLLQAVNQEKRNWLEQGDLEKLSCEDLQIVDRLWSKHSEGRFGFSIQLEIWQSLKQQTYRAFGTQVGWYRQGRWLLLQHLNFDCSAPKGHLPAISWWYGHAIWGLKSLFNKIDSCLTE